MSVDYESMSQEARETAKWMVEFCINHGYAMGMDEGCNEDGSKQAFRAELEAFSGFVELLPPVEVESNEERV